MNYLAHALLSPSDPFILMGNLWGDLLKPRDYASLAPGIIDGVQRHKRIDSYTDQHPSVEEILNILRPYQGKYTPVVADVLMDFILSKYWSRYHDLPISEFCFSIYGTVTHHLHYLPERLHPRINRMVGHQWLESCATRERMEQTLLMLSRRASFKNNIPQAMLPYDLHQPVLEELFISFFEDMRAHINLRNAS